MKRPSIFHGEKRMIFPQYGDDEAARCNFMISISFQLADNGDIRLL